MDLEDIEPEIAAAEEFYDEQNNYQYPPDAELGEDYVHIDVDVISGDVLLDEECDLANVLLSKRRPVTGCSEIDETLLRTGFDRGRVVGISAERDHFALLVGLQTIANVLVAEPDKPSSAMIITTLATEELLPTLKAVVKGQVEALPGVGDAKARSHAALERISISRVFDYDGLRESLDELYLPGEHPLTVPTPSPSTPGTPRDVGMEAEAGNKATLDMQGLPQPSKADYVPLQELERQKVHADEDNQDDGQQLKPDIILITNMPALLVSLYSSRDEDSAETALRNLRRRLRYLTRSVAHRGPLVMLLNSADVVVSYPEEAQFPEMEEADDEEEKATEEETADQAAGASMPADEGDEPGDGIAEPIGEEGKGDRAQTQDGAANGMDSLRLSPTASQGVERAQGPEVGVSPSSPPPPSDPASPVTPPSPSPMAPDWSPPPRRSPSPPSWSPLSAASPNAESPPASPPSPSPILRDGQLDLPPAQDELSPSASSLTLFSSPPSSSHSAAPEPSAGIADDLPEETLRRRLQEILDHIAARVPPTSEQDSSVEIPGQSPHDGPPSSPDVGADEEEPLDQPDDTALLGPVEAPDNPQETEIRMLDASHIPQPGFEPRLTSILQRPPYPPRNIEFTGDGACIVRPEKAQDLLQLWTKPFYGLEFEELLDLHLLCFRLPKEGKTEAGGEDDMAGIEGDEVVAEDFANDEGKSYEDEGGEAGAEERFVEKQDHTAGADQEETHRASLDTNDMNLAEIEAMLAERNVDIGDDAAHEAPVQTDGLVWMVEVLQDRYGVWDGEKDAWVTRDERWCALDVEKRDTGAIKLVNAYSEEDIHSFLAEEEARACRPYQEDYDVQDEGPTEEAVWGVLNSESLGYETDEEEPAEDDDRNINWFHGEELEQSGQGSYDVDESEDDDEDGNEDEPYGNDLMRDGDTDIEGLLEYDDAPSDGHDGTYFSEDDEQSVEEDGTTSQVSSDGGFASQYSDVREPFQQFCIPGFLTRGPCGIRFPLHLLDVDAKARAPWAPVMDGFASGLLITVPYRWWEVVLSDSSPEAADGDVVTDDDSSDAGRIRQKPDDVLWQGHKDYMHVMNETRPRGHVPLYGEFVADVIAFGHEKYHFAQEVVPEGDLERKCWSSAITPEEGSGLVVDGDHEEADVGHQNIYLKFEAELFEYFRLMADGGSSNEGKDYEGCSSESLVPVSEWGPEPECRVDGTQDSPDITHISNVPEEDSDSELSDIEMSDEEVEFTEIKRSAAEYRRRQQPLEAAGHEAETLCPLKAYEQEWQEHVRLLLEVAEGDYAPEYGVLTHVLCLGHGEEQWISDDDSLQVIHEHEDGELKAYWERYLSLMDQARYTPHAMTYEEYLQAIHSLVDGDGQLSAEDAAYDEEEDGDGNQVKVADYEHPLNNEAQHDDDLAQEEGPDDDGLSLATEYNEYIVLMEEAGRAAEAMSYDEFYQDICGRPPSRTNDVSRHMEAHPTEDPVVHDKTTLDDWEDAWADYFVQMDQAGLAAEAMGLDEYIAQATTSTADNEQPVPETPRNRQVEGTLYAAWLDYVNTMPEESHQDESLACEEYPPDITHPSPSSPSRHADGRSRTSIQPEPELDPEISYWGHHVPLLEGQEFDYWASGGGDPEVAYDHEWDEACYEVVAGVDGEQEYRRYMAGWEGPVHGQEVAEWQKCQSCLRDGLLLVEELEAEDTVGAPGAPGAEAATEARGIQDGEASASPEVVVRRPEDSGPEHSVQREPETMADSDSDSELSDVQVSDEEMELWEIDRCAAVYHRQHKEVLDSDEEEDTMSP